MTFLVLMGFGLLTYAASKFAYVLGVQTGEGDPRTSRMHRPTRNRLVSLGSLGLVLAAVGVACS